MVEELFFMVIFFFLISFKNTLIIVIDILKNILTLFMLHHIVLVSSRLLVSNCCPLPKKFLCVTHPSTSKSTIRMFPVQLACVKHATNVHLELRHHLILEQHDPIRKFHLIEHVHQFSLDNYKCSLWDLTQHFMARTDNNHASPIFVFLKALFFFKKIHFM